MIKLTIKELKNILNCECYNEKDVVIQGIERDSRSIEPNNMFAPIKGLKFDGHSFIEEVKKRGVSVSLWNKSIKPYPEDVILLLVEDVERALKDIAKAYIKKINAKVIGVTGSNGKTSIKDMCASILSVSHKTTKTYKNYNNDLGLCLSIFRANDDDEFLVFEMGMDNIGDIDRLISIIDIDVAIISNIGTAHLEFLKTRENIALAKQEILGGIKENGLYIRPLNEPLLTKKHKNTMTFDLESGDIFAKNIKISFDGISFDTNLIQNIKINSFGIVNVLNALPVILACRYFNISDNDILAGLEAVDFTERRNKIEKFNNLYIYDDSYKSNPDGLYKCFETMSLFKDKKFAVLSDMLELGDDEEKFHREVAKVAKEYGIDKLFLYGELSKFTYDECKKINILAKYYENKYEIINDLKELSDGIILFKASNAQKINEVIEDFKNA